MRGLLIDQGELFPRTFGTPPTVEEYELALGGSFEVRAEMAGAPTGSKIVFLTRPKLDILLPAADLEQDYTSQVNVLIPQFRRLILGPMLIVGVSPTGDDRALTDQECGWFTMIDDIRWDCPRLQIHGR